jgi:hypothetical protein
MTVAQCARLARARGAHNDQRAAAVSDHLALRGGEAVERIGHVPRVRLGRVRVDPFGSRSLLLLVQPELRTTERRASVLASTR